MDYRDRSVSLAHSSTRDDNQSEADSDIDDASDYTDSDVFKEDLNSLQISRPTG